MPFPPLLDILAPLGALCHADRRVEAARQLAQALSADEALFFVADPESGELLPAPGFRQTLPARARWRTFLEQVVEGGTHRENLPVTPSAESNAFGMRSSETGVLVLLGGKPPDEVARTLMPALPLVEAALRAEQEARLARSNEQLARSAAAEYGTLATTLDATRHKYQQALLESASAKEELERELTQRRAIEEELRAQRTVVDTINRVNATLAAELNLESLVQVVTDAGTELSGAQFGAFFYNVIDPSGDSLTLYTISGVPREAFSRFPSPRNTPIFQLTFNGESVVRSDDITQDPRFGQMAPHHGMPKGHLPVTSYLAVPVIARSGEVIGGLFFGHSTPGVFTAEAEQIVLGIADQAAIAIENARLFTTLRTTEADLRTLNESLEERVARRTEELQHEVEVRARAESSLSEAVRELNDRNHVLQDFAYVASHDLQEPLRKIIAFSGLLADDYGVALDEQGHHYLSRIQHSAQRMRHLIRDLLSFSRVETQAQKLTEVDLDAVLAEVLDDLEVRLAEHGGRVEAEPLGTLEADPLQMRQVLQNLVGNALKFHRPGVPPVVRIWREDAKGRVYLTIEDNGIGFEPRYQERMFAPFQRLHARSDYEGTGMGLAIVQRIVTRHGGTISASSTPGAGSRFTIELPAPQHHACEAAS